MSNIPHSAKAPQPSGGDIAHTVAKAGLAAIPVLGGSAAEIFNLILAPPIERRRNEWMESIAKGLKDLEDKFKTFKLEQLKDNESFVSLAMLASRSAVMTHDKEKLEALRAALLNTALNHNSEEYTLQMFMHWIDSFTPLHLKILAFFDDPNGFTQKRGIESFQCSVSGSLSIPFEHAMPEIKGKNDIYEPIISELHSMGLIANKSVHVVMNASSFYVRRTNDMGSKFIKFITNPLITT